MALPINTKEQLRQLYRIYSLVSDNAHGNTKGLTGSLNYSSLLLVLRALNITGQGRRLFDCGAADGKVLAAALILGSEGAHGYELPENSSNRYIFQSVMNRIAAHFELNRQAIDRTHLEFSDIKNVSNFSEQICMLCHVSSHFDADKNLPWWSLECIRILGWNGV
jgi:hypothetical protein